MKHCNHERSAVRAARSGSVLVEFAFIALAFYLLFAGTIELGRMITTAQAVQNAARVGARELALVALPPTATFRQALNDPQVRARVYDPYLLAVPAPSGVVPDTSSWPVINRMLTMMMFYDTVGGVELYRYPGAVVRTQSGQYSVKVPIVLDRNSQGVETIRLVDVVEEVTAADGVGPFSLAVSSGIYGERGLVALRINCPYQAASMTAFRIDPAPGDDPVILANDGGVSVDTSSPGGSSSGGFDLIGQSGDIGAYAGRYGLGALYAMDETVRPFRRVISAQSLFRREVYR